MKKNFKTTVTTTLLALAMMLSLTACGSKETGSTAASQDTTVTEAPASQDTAIEDTAADGTVILIDGGFSISFTGTVNDANRGFGLTFNADNTTSSLKTFEFGKIYVDGICICTTDISGMTLQPGADATGYVFINADELARLGITDLSTVDVQFIYTNAAGETTVSDLISVETGETKTTENNYNSDDKGFGIVYDANGITIRAKYVQATKNIVAVMENTTSENAVISYAVTALNDSVLPAHYCGVTEYSAFSAGESAVGVFKVYDAFLGLQTAVENVTLDVTVNNEAFTIDIPVEK